LNNKATSNFGCTRSVTRAGGVSHGAVLAKGGRDLPDAHAASTEPALRRFVQHPFRLQTRS